jgi:SAM-dependent methyltransferase
MGVAHSFSRLFMTVPSTSPASENRLNSTFWENRYQEGTSRWDLGQAAPPLAHLLTQPDAPKPGRAIALGCGRGHDALLFAQHGFQVLGVDYAPSAIAAATAATQNLPAQFIQRDIFDLLPEYEGQFDYVIEHTCFCALELDLRDRYVDLAASLLKPDGQLLGLFFTHSRPGGPPYGSSPEAIRQHFERRFAIASLAPTPYSVPSRQNEEHLGIFQKRP